MTRLTPRRHIGRRVGDVLAIVNGKAPPEKPRRAAAAADGRRGAEAPTAVLRRRGRRRPAAEPPPKRPPPAGPTLAPARGEDHRDGARAPEEGAAAAPAAAPASAPINRGDTGTSGCRRRSLPSEWFRPLTQLTDRPGRAASQSSARSRGAPPHRRPLLLSRASEWRLTARAPRKLAAGCPRDVGGRDPRCRRRRRQRGERGRPIAHGPCSVAEPRRRAPPPDALFCSRRLPLVDDNALATCETLDAAGAPPATGGRRRSRGDARRRAPPASSARQRRAASDRRRRRRRLQLPSEWFYADASNTQHGPLSVDDLRALNDSALGLPPDALFCSPGMSEWLPLDQLPALCAAVTAPRPSPLSRFFVQEAWAEGSEVTEQASPESSDASEAHTELSRDWRAVAREAARRGGDSPRSPPATRTPTSSAVARLAASRSARRCAPRQQSAPRRQRRAVQRRARRPTAGPTRLRRRPLGARRPRLARPADERVRAHAGARSRAADVADRLARRLADQGRVAGARRLRQVFGRGRAPTPRR